MSKSKKNKAKELRQKQKRSRTSPQKTLGTLPDKLNPKYLLPISHKLVEEGIVDEAYYQEALAFGGLTHFNTKTRSFMSFGSSLDLDDDDLINEDEIPF